MTAEREDIYRHVPPPGEPIPVGYPPFPFLVDDSIPEDEDIAWVIRRLRLKCSGSPSGMRTEQLRQWLIAATRDDLPDDTNCLKVVIIVHEAFQYGTLAKECMW